MDLIGKKVQEMKENFVGYSLVNGEGDKIIIMEK